MKPLFNLKNFLNLTKHAFSLFLMVCSVCFSYAEIAKKKQTEIFRGPLKIYADETRVLEHGKKIYARGNVKAKYVTQDKDILESFSNEAVYLDENQTGILKGNPRAFWKQGIGQYSTNLKADAIELRMKDMVLWANGRVRVDQSSNTLLSSQMVFNHHQKKFYTLGKERVRFDALENEYKTTVFSDSVLAWTDRQQIYFLGKVKGKIYLKEGSK